MRKKGHFHFEKYLYSLLSPFTSNEPDFYNSLGSWWVWKYHNHFTDEGTEPQKYNPHHLTPGHYFPTHADTARSEECGESVAGFG